MALNSIVKSASVDVNDGQASGAQASFSPAAGELWFLDFVTMQTSTAADAAVTDNLIFLGAGVASDDIADSNINSTNNVIHSDTTGVGVIINTVGSGDSVRPQRYVHDHQKVVVLLSNDDNNDPATIEVQILIRQQI